jgi:site-specific recombinase XerD
LRRVYEKIGALRLPGQRFVHQYLQHLYRRNLSLHTLRNSATALILFLQLMKKTGRCRIESITRIDLEAFIEHEQDRGLNITTVHSRLGFVKAFVRYLESRGVLQAPVSLKGLSVRLPDALPRAMDDKDVDRLVNTLGNVQERAMILVLLRTGMRIGELLNCKVCDIRLAENKILIYRGEKNHRGRAVCLSPDARSALEQWMAQRDPLQEYLFYSRCRPTISYTTARNIFCGCLEKAGLSGKGYTLHCLRHTFATQLLNARLPIECLQQLLGHSSLEITQRYARLSDRTREEEYFKAMAKIEQEATDATDRFDHPLPAVFEAEKLLEPHAAKLPEPS